MNDYNWKHILFTAIIIIVLIVSNTAHAAKAVLSNDISNLQLQSYCGPRNNGNKYADEYRLFNNVCVYKNINILKAQQMMRDWK